MTSIYVTWSQRLEDFIKGFNITSVYMGSCSLDYENTINGNLNSSTRQYNITDLQENSNYSIIITVFNDGGHNSSKVLSIITNSSALDGAPNDLKVVSTNLTAINITWAPVNCTQQNSVIKGYTVHYRKNSEDRESRYTDDTNAIIVKLDPNTEYVLEVQAVNNENMTGPLAELNVNTSIPEGKDIKINYLGFFF